MQPGAYHDTGHQKGYGYMHQTSTFSARSIQSTPHSATMVSPSCSTCLVYQFTEPVDRVKGHKDNNLPAKHCVCVSSRECTGHSMIMRHRTTTRYPSEMVTSSSTPNPSTRVGCMGRCRGQENLGCSQQTMLSVSTRGGWPQL